MLSSLSRAVAGSNRAPKKMSRITLVIFSRARLISRDGLNLRSLSLETCRWVFFADLFAVSLTSSLSRIAAFSFSASATKKDLSTLWPLAMDLLSRSRESLFTGEGSTTSASPMRFCGSEFFPLFAPKRFDAAEFRTATALLVWATGADGGKMPSSPLYPMGHHGTNREEAAEKSPTKSRRCGQPLPTDLEKQCYPIDPHVSCSWIL